MNPFDQTIATILYVDDEELACKYFARAFGGDYHVLTAPSAEVAVALLQGGEFQIDVVVTDFQMPERNGGDLLRQIEKEFPDVIRVLVTAYADKNLLLQTVNSSGVFRILEKPLDMAETRISLRKAVDLCRIRRERKNRFMAIDETLGFLAHELNTPLASISNFARGIQRRTAQGNATAPQQLEIEKVAQEMQNNARYCMAVLSTFVDSLRDTGTSVLGRRDSTAKQLIDSLLDAYPLSGAQRAMIEVEVIEDFLITTLPNCVSLVLSSILTNALRALAQTENPGLRFVVTVEDHPLIRVMDNGPGIPRPVMDHLMEDPITMHADSGGSGWGMIFCRRIMQSFGGGIQVMSELGRSTCIVLDFPLIKEQIRRSDR